MYYIICVYYTHARRVCVCLYIHKYTYTYIDACIYIYIYIHTYMRTYIHHMYIHIGKIISVYVHTDHYIYTHTDNFTLMYVCMMLHDVCMYDVCKCVHA